MGDRHLEKAAEAVENDSYWRSGYYGQSGGPCGYIDQSSHPAAATIVAAYLDSLLGELPEEAVEAAAFDLYASGPWGEFVAFVGEFGQTAAMDNHSMETYRSMSADSAQALLRSLRDSLASGTGGQNEG